MSYKTPRSEMAPEELERVRRMERMTAYRRALYGGGFVSAARMQAVIRRWVDDEGITQRLIADSSGICLASIQQHYAGRSSRGPLTMCSSETERTILSLRFKPDDRRHWGAAGIRRRLQALIVVGYTTRWLAAESGKTTQQVSAFILGNRNEDHGTVDRVFGDRVREMFEKYIDIDPLVLGHKSHGVNYARTVARRRNYAPAHCWDEDTIDNPDAKPEWTGACGSQTGWEIHHREGIPMCDPCAAVREVDTTIPHSLSDMDIPRREADCAACGHRVDIISHSRGRNAKTAPRFRCGPHMRELTAIRTLKAKALIGDIDRLTEAGLSAAEIARELKITDRTVLRNRAKRRKASDG